MGPSRIAATIDSIANISGIPKENNMASNRAVSYTYLFSPEALCFSGAGLVKRGSAIYLFLMRNLR
jgi:hypothetical protein